MEGYQKEHSQWTHVDAWNPKFFLKKILKKSFQTAKSGRKRRNIVRLIHCCMNGSDKALLFVSFKKPLKIFRTRTCMYPCVAQD